jgi:hypothetical protein
MDSEVFIQILEAKATSARLEEKLIGIEKYVLNEFQIKLAENAIRMESRFKWVVGLFVTFVATSIGVSVALWSGGT